MSSILVELLNPKALPILEDLENVGLISISATVTAHEREKIMSEAEMEKKEQPAKKKEEESIVDSLYGSWQSEKPAEEMVKNIRESRYFDRNYESL